MHGLWHVKRDLTGTESDPANPHTVRTDGAGNGNFKYLQELSGQVASRFDQIFCRPH